MSKQTELKRILVLLFCFVLVLTPLLRTKARTYKLVFGGSTSGISREVKAVLIVPGGAVSSHVQGGSLVI